jgi:DNA mismatch repair protein MutS2
MLSSRLPQLEWDILIDKLSGACKTEAANKKIKETQPNLKSDEIISRWAILTPLKELVDAGYTPSIGSIEPMEQIFRSLSIGGLLDGEELRNVLLLLEATKINHKFCLDFKSKCDVLDRFLSGLFPLPKLLSDIDRTVDQDGKIKDEASKELYSIRGQKRHLATRIQNKIKALLHDHEIEMYLQDDFFTVRNDKYVIPMRLDGHGRIKGNVIDTSGSGQTLFLEPQEVAESNQKLQDLESEERLEILRILRGLSASLSGSLDELTANYETIIDLDYFTAQAKVFSELECHKPQLVNKKTINLKDAFHPILKFNEDNVVENSISLEESQNCLVISGPNAGGKTVVLKTVAFCHLMAKCGFLIPASNDSELFLFENIFLELGDGQSVTQSLSSFSSHLYGLKPIIESASPKDLVLLDEIAIGTEPNVGAAIAQSILEDLNQKGVTTLVTTHFEKLKILAIENKSMRNASMEYSTSSFSATFRLILDVPGQSYGLELATKIGIPQNIIDRAEYLSGQNTSELDSVIAEVLKIKQIAMDESKDLKEKTFEAEKQKNRWEHEVSLLQQTRKKTAEKLKSRFEQKFQDKLDEIDEAKKELKKASNDHKTQKAKSNANKSLSGLKDGLSELNQFVPDNKHIPGFDITWDQVELGLDVYVIPLEKSGTITKIAKEKKLIEVQVGLLKVRSKIDEVRRLKVLKGTSKKTNHSTPNKSSGSQSDEFVVQTSANSVNLRGLDSDQGVERALSFIDSGLLKGEKAIFLIHGHGTSALKNAIRNRLSKDCPYDINFRPGTPEEGGDGVTVVTFK